MEPLEPGEIVFDECEPPPPSGIIKCVFHMSEPGVDMADFFYQIWFKDNVADFTDEVSPGVYGPPDGVYYCEPLEELEGEE